MPIWSGINWEIDRAGGDFDAIRKGYIFDLHQKSGRNVILYVSSFVQKSENEHIYISDEDMHALMEVSHGLDGKKGLDLILHSPGGSVEAAEAMVDYLRSRFSDIRVIVPHLAMSAATMIACAANRICLGKHSFLGPTDSQIFFATHLGTKAAPAQSILDLFSQAKRDCSVNPEHLAVWRQVLQFYTPDLLGQCETALELSRELVETWLKTHMFSQDKKKQDKAKDIAKWLSDHKNFKSHVRHISRNQLKNRGLKIENLEDDDVFEDLVLSVFHAATHAFAETDAVKIVENHLGRAFAKQAIVQQPVFQQPQSEQPEPPNK